MRKLVIPLLFCASLSVSGCFLVGYDGLQGTPDENDSGMRPDLRLPDASSDDDDDDVDDDDYGDMDASADAASTPPDGTVDAAPDMDAAFDAGDGDGAVDASAADAGDLDASPDASPNDAGEEPDGDGGSPMPDAGVDSGSPMPDAAVDSGSPVPDAAVDSGSPVPDAGQDAGPPPPDAETPPPDPLPYCSSNQECTLGCGDVPMCTPTCDSDTRCDIDCDGADYCKPTCNKSRVNICEIDCTGTDRCDATCKGGGDCMVDCRQSGTCDKVRCEGGLLQLTQCMIVCEANDPSCGFEYCWGDSLGWISIGGLGVTVKQQTCTGDNGLKVVLCGGTYGFSDVNPYLPCQAK